MRELLREVRSPSVSKEDIRFLVGEDLRDRRAEPSAVKADEHLANDACRLPCEARLTCLLTEGCDQALSYFMVTAPALWLAVPISDQLRRSRNKRESDRSSSLLRSILALLLMSGKFPAEATASLSTARNFEA